MPNGSKQWLLNYIKPISKKRTSLTFGKYPEVSLAEARKKRVAARELLAKDIDPKEFNDDKHLSTAGDNDHYSNTLYGSPRVTADRYYRVTRKPLK